MYLVTRSETFAKLFFIISLSGLFMYIALAFYSLHTAYSVVYQSNKYVDRLRKFNSWDSNIKRYDKDLKYILIWTMVKPDNPIGEGQTVFINNNCSYVNCFLTTNKTILNGNYRNFNAVVFNMSTQIWAKRYLPKTRSEAQKYVFHSLLPSTDFPLCNFGLDGYFNWTWSYKFYSDIFSPFIEVKNMKGEVVAPNTGIIWEGNMTFLPAHKIKSNIYYTKGRDTNVDVELVTIKTKAVAWIIDNCQTKFSRMEFAINLNHALKEESLELDMYGCGTKECPHTGCLKMIEANYFFYLAYEDSNSEDYVTQEVLKAYHHDAVPIVVGGADYDMFLPKNSYVDSRNFNVDELASFIKYLIVNREAYHQFFKWKKYYTINAVEGQRGVCQLCALMNDRNRVEAPSSYSMIRKWWYTGDLSKRCYPKGAENYNEVFSYLNETHTSL